MLLVENPGYIFVRESAATTEENYKSLHQRRRDHRRPSHQRQLKDRKGDQRGGGSEWEPIKILLEGD
jgi:hypothetical protein